VPRHTVSIQWNQLLARPLYSALHVTYAFIREIPEDVGQLLWPPVFSELFHSIAMVPMLHADLCRPWHPTTMTADASPSFGFGINYARAPPDVVRSAARLAPRRAHHFPLKRQHGDPVEVPRHGRCHRSDLRMRDLKVAMCAKSSKKEHSGAMEAHGALLAVTHVVRRRVAHNHRTLFLLDAQAVVDSVQKGRSSAPTLRPEISHVAGLLSPANIQARFGYLPSGSNPSDYPSRGKGHPFYRSRPKPVIEQSKLDTHMSRLRMVARRDKVCYYTGSLLADQSFVTSDDSFYS